MSFQMQPSTTSLSKPLQLVQAKTVYTDKVLTSTPDNVRVTRGAPLASDFKKEARYDIVRTSNAEVKVAVYPDGQPVLAAADLPCLSKLTDNQPRESIDSSATIREQLGNNVPTDVKRTADILANPKRQKLLTLENRTQVPVFMPPLQVGTNFLDPQQINERYTDQERYELQTQAKFVVEPGNASCVNCNLRVYPFKLLSGFGPIATSEGEKPYLYPQIVNEKPIYAPSVGILPNGTAENTEVLAASETSNIKKLIKAELDRFAVKTVPSPPPILYHSIVYESDPNGCDTPKSLGFSHGNLVERGMNVNGTISSLSNAICGCPVIPAVRFSR